MSRAKGSFVRQLARLLGTASLGALVACGGGSSSPSASATASNPPASGVAPGGAPIFDAAVLHEAPVAPEQLLSDDVAAEEVRPRPGTARRFR